MTNERLIYEKEPVLMYRSRGHTFMWNMSDGTVHIKRMISSRDKGKFSCPLEMSSPLNPASLIEMFQQRCEAWLEEQEKTDAPVQQC